jgi:hypothetical protein
MRSYAASKIDCSLAEAPASLAGDDPLLIGSSGPLVANTKLNLRSKAVSLFHGASMNIKILRERLMQKPKRDYKSMDVPHSVREPLVATFIFTERALAVA